MVSIGIAQTFIFDFILFRRSHRPALRKMTLDWFQKFATVIRAREQAWEDYFDRENPQPMDERIGNEASLARMTALGAVEAVCYQLARAAGEVDNLGLNPPKVERKDA